VKRQIVIRHARRQFSFYSLRNFYGVSFKKRSIFATGIILDATKKTARRDIAAMPQRGCSGAAM